jgi:formyl-CoA transferase
MLEAVYPTMASNIGMIYGARDDIPLRTGNRHGGLSLCPYNVYPTRDGYIAIICNNDRHWSGLLEAMGRGDLVQDPRVQTMRDRVSNMDFVDDLVARYTSQHLKEYLSGHLQEHKVPNAPVRDLTDVIADPVLRERGMLIDVNHPAYGELTLPRSPLRFSDTEQRDYVCSPEYAADNARIYGRLGMNAEELAMLAEEGVL